MYNWIRRKFEFRSIAEMSIFYTITAVVSFLVVFLLWVLITGLVGGPEDFDNGAIHLLNLLIALLLWLGFLAWLWISLVRTAWKWNKERLGIKIFKYLQIGFFVMTVLTMLVRRELRGQVKVLVGLLVVFDIVIVIMIFNFLLLTWLARCKISLRAYWEISSIVVMIVIQFWLFISTYKPF